MPTRISVECTHCGAKLNLPDETKLGKKIKCPKCSEVFVAASSEDDELEDEEEVEFPRKKQAAAPAGKKGAAAKGGKKGKKGKSGGNLGLIIGGVVGVIVVLGGLVGVLFATGAFSGKKADPNQITVSPQTGPGVFAGLLKEQGPTPIPPRTTVPEAAKWLPANSEFIVHVRPAEILGSPLVKGWLKSFQLEELVNGASAEFGLSPADVESVTLAVAELDKVQQQFQQAQMAMMMGGQPQLATLNTPAIGVVQLKKPVTYDVLTKFLGQVSNKDQPPQLQKVQHAGKEFLEATDSKTSMKNGAYLVSESLLLLGDSANLKAAIDKGPNPTPVVNFGFIDWTDHVALAYAPQKPETLKQQFSAGSLGNPMAAMALAPLAEGASGFSFGLTVKGGLEAEVAVGCVNPEKTDLIAKSLTDLSSMGQGQYGKSKSELPPWASALTDQLVANLKVSGTNRVVLMSTNIPDSAQEQLAQLPGMIMAQFAMSAMLGGGLGATPPNAPAFPPSDSGSPGDSSNPPIVSSEPSSVTATSAEGLPKQLELKGSLSDGFHRAGKSDRPLAFSLELNYQGEGSDCNVAAVGKLQPGQFTAGGGDSGILEPINDDEDQEHWELMFNGDGFVSFSSGAGNYQFGIPLLDAKPLREIEGKFSYITGKRSKLIQVKDFRAQAGKAASDPALKAAGLEMNLAKEMDTFGETEKLTVSVKPGFLITKLQIIDEKGEPSFDAFTGLSQNKQMQIVQPGVGSLELKPGLGIQFYLYSDLKEVEVPFKFENIPLPKKMEDESK